MAILLTLPSEPPRPWPKATPSPIVTLQAKIVEVVSGDTLKIDFMGFSSGVLIHLWGIDAPEEGQPGFKEAKLFLAGTGSSSWIGSTVKVNVVDVGRDGTVEATIERTFEVSGQGFLDERISLLIHTGWVWWYSKQAPDWPDFKQLMENAPKLRIGLWKDDLNPIPPWTYRTRKILEKRTRADAVLLWSQSLNLLTSLAKLGT